MSLMGLLPGDKGYLSEAFREELLGCKQIAVETPVRHNMSDTLEKPWRQQLNKLRRRVEQTLVNSLNVSIFRKREPGLCRV